MDTDIEFLHQLRAELVRLEGAQAGAQATEERPRPSAWKRRTPVLRHTRARTWAVAAVLGGCAVVVASVLLIQAHSGPGSSPTASAPVVSPAVQARLQRNLINSLSASAATPTAVPPLLGHPFPAGASRVISYKLAREAAPWLALPPPSGQTSAGAPAKVWAARTYVAGNTQPELALSLYYPEVGGQLTEYSLPQTVSVSSYINRLHAPFGEDRASKVTLPDAPAIDSRALIVAGDAGHAGYNSVSLVVGRTVVVLYGTMPLPQIESLATALTPNGAT